MRSQSGWGNPQSSLSHAMYYLAYACNDGCDKEISQDNFIFLKNL